MIIESDVELAREISDKYGRRVYGSIWIEEWAYLYRLVRNIKPKCILEIGSFHHLSSTAFLKGIEDNALGHLLSLDIKFPEPDFHYGMVPWTKLEISSHDIMPKMISKFNLIFVDGDHSYASAKIDIINSLKLINDDGVIVIHDSNYPPTKEAINDTLGGGVEYWSYKPDKFHGMATYQFIN